MKLLHKIKYGMYRILILKNELQNQLGTMVAINTDCVYDYDLLVENPELDNEAQIEALKNEGARLVIPIYKDQSKSSIISYYVYFYDPEKLVNDVTNYDELEAILYKELKYLYEKKYKIVLKNRKREIRVITAATIIGVQKALDLFRVPFEFTADEQLCILHKNSKKHTKKHCYAKCKYYKTKEGSYVAKKNLPEIKTDNSRRSD